MHVKSPENIPVLLTRQWLTFCEVVITNRWKLICLHHLIMYHPFLQGPFYSAVEWIDLLQAGTHRMPDTFPVSLRLPILRQTQRDAISQSGKWGCVTLCNQGLAFYYYFSLSEHPLCYNRCGDFLLFCFLVVLFFALLNSHWSSLMNFAKLCWSERLDRGHSPDLDLTLILMWSEYQTFFKSRVDLTSTLQGCVTWAKLSA